MAKTKRAVTPKIRFEVFKRDSFTCQYCGKSAPQVVLHVDHIKPIANDGDNNILNLVTSCSECNFGKGKRELKDDAVITKQMKELSLMQERRDQLQMIMEWRSELAIIIAQEQFCIFDELYDTFPHLGIDECEKYASDLHHHFGVIISLDAINIAKHNNKIDMHQVINYIFGICVWSP